MLSRPDPQALWKKKNGSLWQNANARFEKDWQGRKTIPKDWKIKLNETIFSLKLSSFKHIGIFPEQSENWKWIFNTIKKTERPVSVLNLFGYTGGATMSALRAGAEVCHVDGSKVSISWAKENIELSGFKDKPVRFILDDVISFVKREIRRGKRYDAIIMDPPAFGHGPKGESWKIEKHLPLLLELCQELLSEKPLFIILNGYAAGYSPISYSNMLEQFESKFGGSVSYGELSIEESKSGRLLPAGIFARWTSNDCKG